MFTTQKSKLFFNDPKFHEIKYWNTDSQQSAVNKIFAGQRQLKRAKISYSASEDNKNNKQNPYIMLDFLQSRMGAYEQKLVQDTEEQSMFLEKERIKEKYSQAEDLYEKANRKLKRLMTNARKQYLQFSDIHDIENQVNQVQRLYEENQFLKNMNQEIKQRIQKKQLQLGTLRK